HLYFNQMHEGIAIANAVSNMNLDAKTGAIVSIHSAFAPASTLRTASSPSKRDADKITPEQAVLMFAKAKGFVLTDNLKATHADKSWTISGASFARQPIIASEKYYQTQDGNLVHTWDLQIRTVDDWLNVFVDSASGDVVGVSSWTYKYGHLPWFSISVPPVEPSASTTATSEDCDESTESNGYTPINAPAPSDETTSEEPEPSPEQPATSTDQQPVPEPSPSPSAPSPPSDPTIKEATYDIVPIGVRNPSSNNGLTRVTSPWDTTASPKGWHNQETLDLSGNNVFAQSNPNNVQEPEDLIRLPRLTDPSLSFAFAYDAMKGAKYEPNANAATVNMFYVANSAHDVFYRYGFTEEAGNFQAENFGRGGSEGDAVIATSQDASGMNNANFMSPPDGQSGVMRMYVFDSAQPTRDGAFENDIVIHEMAHGLSTRLTGGPSNANCLNGGIPGGLGEGWSDTFAYILTMPATQTRVQDYALGVWVVDSAKGVRQYPYSTDTNTNPHMYSRLAEMTQVHAVGEVWATMLYEVLWNMVDLSGFTAPSEIVRASTSGTGNTDLLLLLIAGLKAQPCSPTFVQARDAILEAETSLFNGKYKCAVWNGFAKRGLGSGVSDGASFSDNFEIPNGCTKTF
ncbi:Fungalysin metallopeptidase-domain-containing protein, partial [Chytriomyces cf. hyalinus JEL632]